MLLNPARREIKGFPVLAPVAQIRFFYVLRKLCREFTPFRVAAVQCRQEFITMCPFP